MVNPYLERRNGPRDGHLPAPVARADPGAHAGRAAVSGAAHSHGHGGGRLLRRPGRGAAAGDGIQALATSGWTPSRQDLRAGMTQQRDHRRGAGRDRRRDQIVRALRISRIARGVVRPLAYASAYLKAHHPAAFLAALLNNWPMGFYHPSTLVTDAVRHGVARPAHRRHLLGLAVAIWKMAGARCASACASGRATGSGGAADGGGASDGAVRLACRLRRPRGPERRRSWPRWPTSARLRAGRNAPRGALASRRRIGRSGALFAHAPATTDDDDGSPLPEMTEAEEMTADFARHRPLVGPHPIAFARADLDAARAWSAAAELARVRQAGGPGSPAWWSFASAPERRKDSCSSPSRTRRDSPTPSSPRRCSSAIAA